MNSRHQQRLCERRRRTDDLQLNNLSERAGAGNQRRDEITIRHSYKPYIVRIQLVVQFCRSCPKGHLAPHPRRFLAERKMEWCRGFRLFLLGRLRRCTPAVPVVANCRQALRGGLGMAMLSLCSAVRSCLRVERKRNSPWRLGLIVALNALAARAVRSAARRPGSAVTASRTDGP